MKSSLLNGFLNTQSTSISNLKYLSFPLYPKSYGSFVTCATPINPGVQSTSDFPVSPPKVTNTFFPTINSSFKVYTPSTVIFLFPSKILCTVCGKPHFIDTNEFSSCLYSLIIFLITCSNVSTEQSLYKSYTS